MKSEKIQEEKKIIREYQINIEDFCKFFPIEGKFQTISIENGNVTRHDDGMMVSHSLNSGQPWIRISTTEVNHLL